MAFNPTKRDGVCTGDQSADSDQDGMNDCEESGLNLEKNRFDSDGDLFPDAFEMMSGTNPADATDVNQDLDFDGAKTGDEIRSRTKISVDDRKARDYYSFTYRLDRVFDAVKGSVCYNFEIGNVGVVRTQAYRDRPAGQNEIVLDVIESPKDDPDRLFSLCRYIFKIDYGDYENDLFATQATFTQVSTQEIPVTR